MSADNCVADPIDRYHCDAGKECWCDKSAMGISPYPINTGGDSSYYEFPPNCARVQDLIIKKGMCWNQANILKSVYRWDHKPDLEYNLRKIIWFATDELDRLYERERPPRD